MSTKKAQSRIKKNMFWAIVFFIICVAFVLGVVSSILLYVNATAGGSEEYPLWSILVVLVLLILFAAWFFYLGMKNWIRGRNELSTYVATEELEKGDYFLIEEPLADDASSDAEVVDAEVVEESEESEEVPAGDSDAEEKPADSNG